MSIISRFVLAALAAAAVVLSAGVANAAISVATSVANLRAGGGVAFPVVGSLYKGERVRVIRCEGAWCLVIHRGTDGWAHWRLLVNPQYDRGRGFEFPKGRVTKDRPMIGRYNGTPPAN